MQGEIASVIDTTITHRLHHHLHQHSHLHHRLHHHLHHHSRLHYRLYHRYLLIISWFIISWEASQKTSLVDTYMEGSLN
jgi:hypothetical protein